MFPRVCVFLVAVLCVIRPAVAADAESEILEAEKSWAEAVKARDLDALEALLHDRFGLGHTTLQVDHQSEPELLKISGLDEAEDDSPDG